MNAILIMADTWRFDYLGCYGNDWIQTPNIDRFAEESTVFENAYAEGLPTIPVRRALQTGRYTLCSSGWGPLSPEDLTVADILYSNSTRSSLIYDTGPMHIPRYGYSRGFDFVQYIRGHWPDEFYRHDPCSLKIEQFHKPFYDPEQPHKKVEHTASLYAREELLNYLPLRQHWTSDEDHMVAQLSKAAMDHLERIDKNKPFFLWLDSFDPHEPWDPPSVWDPNLKCPYDPEYEGIDITTPAPPYVDWYLTDEETRHIRMLYAEKITMVDKWLGKVLDKLRDLDLFDDSLIIFMSDHGQPLGNNEHGHGIIRKCRPWPYEELSHIPLITHCPGVKGQRISSFVETVDIAPTIMDFLKVNDQTEQMQGKNLLPLIRGEIDKVKDFAVSGYFNVSWSIVTDDWSYIHWLDEKVPDRHKILATIGMATMKENTEIWTCTPGSDTETPETDELYDRKQDPFQLNNLLDQKPDVGKELFLRLRDYMLALRMNG